MKKFLAILLALIMVAALVGCGKKKRQPITLTLSTEDSEAILNAAGIRLPPVEEASGANSTVQWFAWYDPFQNYDEAQIVNTGFFTFREKYGGSIEWVETDYFERNNDLARLISGGTPPDFSPCGTGATAVYPMDCIKGMYVSVDQYIDYDDPLWLGMKPMGEQYMLGTRHYAIITDVKTSNVVVYNRRVIEEYGYDDPAELYANDSWTWDVFYDYCLDFSDPDANRFALDGYAYNGMFIEAVGMQLLQRDENGFYSNIDAPEFERGMQYLYDLVKNDCTYHEGTSRWALRGDFGAGMKEGDCLYYVIGPSFFTGTVEEIENVWGDLHEHEVMFAPLPRDEQGDGVYYLGSSPEGYMLVSDGANHEGAVLLAMCERFKIIDPTVIRVDVKQMMETYLWSQEMMDMYDECYNISARKPVIDYTGNLQTQLNSALQDMKDAINRSNEPATWGQLKEKNGELIDYYIADLNNSIVDAA